MNRLPHNAHELLTLIEMRDIPSTLCDMRPKLRLLREGYAVIWNELTNTMNARGGNTYVRRVLHITSEGHEYLRAMRLGDCE